MTIQENLLWAIEQLQQKGIEEPVEKEYIMVHDTREMEGEKKEEYRKFIRKLEEGYPLQYITHHQEFMKLDFYVEENVLIPRADTEITVEEVITYCKNKKEKLRILDLCTGSGAIAISLGKYLPDCEIVAVDISIKALEVAKKNAKQNKVNHVTFLQSDLFEKVEGKFNVIVSNPPYIKTEVIATLAPQVQKEPMLALDGGADGLVFYRKILEQAEKFLEKNGAIFLEIGYDQKEEVIRIIQETGEYSEIQTKKDLFGNNRMIMTKKAREGEK